MHQTIKIFIYFLLLFLIGMGAFAQNSEENNSAIGFKMIASSKGDSIMLRWAPVNYESWIIGNKYGYYVSRKLLVEGDNILLDQKEYILNDNPLKPSSVDDFEALSEETPLAAVAAQAIYGRSFEPETENSSPVVSIFNRATEQQNRYSFGMFAADQSAKVAKNMALSFVDREIKSNKKYLYRIYLANNDTITYDTAYIFIGTDEVYPLAKPRFTQIFPEGSTVSLEWQCKPGVTPYSSYELFKSTDNGKSFKKVNKSPLINTNLEDEVFNTAFYIDTLKHSATRYFYKVRGINPFGEVGPFSDTIGVTAKPKADFIPHIISSQVTDIGVEIFWSVPEEYIKSISEFRITRASSVDGDYLNISNSLETKVRKFTDTLPIQTAYYKVIAISNEGEHLSSFPRLFQAVDSIPPLAPTGITASIDSLGNVKLIWKANAETDIFGYRIYRANSHNEEFSQLTSSPVKDTLFYDQISLKTLTRKVYYRLMAVDKRQNHSEMSKIYELSRPDIVPPTPPVIKTIYSDQEKVCINFIPSSSYDVREQVLIRKNNGEWQKILEFSSSDTIVCDSTGITNVKHQYSLQSIDSAGLSSEIKQIVVGVKKASGNELKANLKVNRANHSIDLVWDNISPEGNITIYRSENGKNISVFKIIDSKLNQYTDTDIKPDTEYQYLLKFTGAGQIRLSEKLNIKF